MSTPRNLLHIIQRIHSFPLMPHLQEYVHAFYRIILCGFRHIAQDLPLCKVFSLDCGYLLELAAGDRIIISQIHDHVISNLLVGSHLENPGIGRCFHRGAHIRLNHNAGIALILV